MELNNLKSVILGLLDSARENLSEDCLNGNRNKITKTISIEKIALQKDWSLQFEKGWDTPEAIQLPELKSLTKLSNEAIQHYSGTMTYSKSFLIEEKVKHTILNLGEVANIAEFWCNGKKWG